MQKMAQNIKNSFTEDEPTALAALVSEATLFTKYYTV